MWNTKGLPSRSLWILDKKRIPLLKVSGLEAKGAESPFNYIVSFHGFKPLLSGKDWQSRFKTGALVGHVFSLGPL